MSIAAYFLTRTKDNYVLSRENFSNKLKIKDLIAARLNPDGTYKYLTRAEIEDQKMKRKVFVNKLLLNPKIIKFKQQYFANLLKKQPKPPSMNIILVRSPGQKYPKPIIENLWTPGTEEEMKKARADKAMDDYLIAIDDAKSRAVKDIIKSAYGVFECKDSDEPNCMKNAVENLLLKAGIAALEIGLACAGLGFLNPIIDKLFGGDGESDGPPPIDYDRITNIVRTQAIDTYIDNMNIQIKNVKDWFNAYTASKTYNTQASCDDSTTTDKIISCMTHPDSQKTNLKFDPSLIVQNTGTLEGKTINKRVYLTNAIETGPLFKMINHDDVYAINGIITYGLKSASAATQLYSTFKLVIGFYIIYYQEMAMLDQNTSGTKNNKYYNPWFSKYIGEPTLLRKKQRAGSLLGDLQDLCEKLFYYLKVTFYLYFSSLIISDHSDKCYAGSLDCVRWFNIVDSSNCCDQNWWNLINVKYPAADFTWGPYLTNLDPAPIYKMNAVASFMFFFNDYMNFPFDNMALLKNMAGIDVIAGEQDFNWRDFNTYHNTNSTVYSTNGGFPFGSSKMSYETTVDVFTNPNSYKSNSSSNYMGASYCTPYIPSEEEKGVTCGNGFSNIKPFDATVFNIRGDPKKYTDNMYCNLGQSAVSCVRAGMSPGTNQGDIEKNSRTAFCVNTENNETSDLQQANKVLVGKCSTNEILWFFNYTIEANGINLRVASSLGPAPYSDEVPEFRKGGKYYNLKIDNYSPDVFDITDYIKYLIESYKVNYGIDLPPLRTYFRVLLNLSLSKIPADPGTLDGTTRPPINLEASISEYPIEIISASNIETNLLKITAKIYKD
jgi:hypothetical protein